MRSGEGLLLPDADQICRRAHDDFLQVSHCSSSAGLHAQQAFSGVSIVIINGRRIELRLVGAICTATVLSRQVSNEDLGVRRIPASCCFMLIDEGQVSQILHAALCGSLGTTARFV